MDRSPAVEHFHLNARIERFKREELDLCERVAKRVSAVESEGRWLKSDPMYQSLSSVLAGVRRDLKNAEKELLRRGRAQASEHAVASAIEAELTGNAGLSGRKFMRLVQRWKQRFSRKPAYQS